MALEFIEPAQNSTPAISGDPAFAMTAAAFAPANQDDIDPAIEMQAENEAAALQSLAQRLNEEANAPGISDEHKGQLQSLAANCMSKAGELRMGSSSAKSMALMGASALYARAFTQSSSIETQEKMDDELAAAQSEGVSAESFAAARSDFMMYNAIAANRMQARIDELGEDMRSGVVALTVMKSQTAGLLWDNREDEAHKLGYEKGTEQYNQFMDRTLERAMEAARGEGREQIFASLTPEQKEAYLRTHRDPLDRTQDDQSYKTHYENAKEHALSNANGWSAEDIKRLEANPDLYKDNPADKGKDFLVALKMDPDEARRTLEKYGTDTTKQELIDKLKAQGMSDADIQKETDNYLRAKITVDFHQSLSIEDTRLQETALLANAQERDIQQKLKAHKIDEPEARKELEQLQQTTLERMRSIRNEHLDAPKFEQEHKRQCDNPGNAQQALTCEVLNDDNFSKKLHDQKPEKHAEADRSHEIAVMNTEKHIAGLVDKGILPIAYAPETEEKVQPPEKLQASVTSSTIVMAALLQAEGFKGINLNPANMNHTDAFELSHNAAKAEGYVKQQPDLAIKL